jgi:hypothetical protein
MARQLRHVAQTLPADFCRSAGLSVVPGGHGLAGILARADFFILFRRCVTEENRFQGHAIRSTMSRERESWFNDDIGMRLLRKHSPCLVIGKNMDRQSRLRPEFHL